jgi:hypothetical protein
LKEAVKQPKSKKEELKNTPTDKMLDRGENRI